MSAACCALPRGRGRTRRWFGVGGSIGPGAMLLLLPKCPACVAAYLAVWTGAGLAAPVAEYLRPVLAVVFVISVVYLTLGLVRRRFAAG
ncbi:MAG TPA: hypothetical protein VF214_08360 [Edaphobacter sp.]